MTLLIDSNVVDIARQPGETFATYCTKIMDWLLEQNLSIGSCRIDGQSLTTQDQAEELFASAQSIEVQSIGVRVALQAGVALQCNAMRKLENDCQSLITDCLLAEPGEISGSWSGLCQELQGVLKFIPTLGALLSEEQVNFLADQKFKTLDEIMQEMNQVMNKADTVAMSDLLELKLLPWLTSLREFLQAQLPVIDSLGATHA
jgi:hypothetical protein